MTGATTVVVATRNRSEELARTLRELAALRPSPPVVVVDNASTDGTSAVASASPNTELVRLPRNLGAAARNIGVARARTPFVAFSDDDSWWAPDALPLAEEILRRQPRLALLAARTLVGPDERTDPTNELMADSPLGHGPDLPGPSVLGFLACSSVVRVAAYQQVGGFSGLLHFAAEETLLALDLATAGWALCYCPEVRAHHHPSPHRSSSGARRRLEQRNNALISWMRRPLGTALRGTAALAGAVPTDPGAAVALAGTLRRLPLALRTRRRLPDALEHDVRLLEAAP